MPNQQIGDREIAGIGTLDIGKEETSKPKIKIGKRSQAHAEAMTGKTEGPVDRVFNRDSNRESNELIRLKGKLNDPVNRRTQ